MAELVVAYRPMWPTLLSSGIIFPVFIAFNWNIPTIPGVENASFIWPVVYNMVFAIAMPLLGLYQSVQNLVHVWAVRRSLASRRLVVDGPSVSVLTLCPLYIRIASALPGQSKSPEPDLNYSVPDLEPLLDVSGASRSSSSSGSDLLEKEVDVIKFPDTTSFGSKFLDVAERAALLASGLLVTTTYAPKLASLRKRNRFQTAVTVLAPCWSLLNVIQRIAQRLATSPVEALSTFISVIVLVQVIICCYACGNCQRPLVLCLTPTQLSRFQSTPRDDLTSYFTWYHLLFFNAFWLSIVLLLLVISSSYFFHYLQPPYFLCSLSAMLFFVSVIMFAIIFITIHLLNRPLDYKMIILVAGNVMFVSSVIVALFSTTKYWTIFQQPYTGCLSRIDCLSACTH